MKSDLDKSGYPPLNVTPVKCSPWVVPATVVPILAAFNWLLLATTRPGEASPAGALAFIDLLVLAPTAFGFLDVVRRRGRGVTVSQEGLTPTFNGVPIRTVPWEEIGGIRKQSPRGFKGKFRTEEFGPAVFDRTGLILFHIPFPYSRRYSRADESSLSPIRLFWYRVKLHLPADALIEEPPVVPLTPPSWRSIKRKAIFGPIYALAGVGLTVFALNGIRSGVAGALFLSIPSIGLVGTGVGLVAAAFLEMGRMKHPELYSKRDDAALPEPIEGPTIVSHVLQHGSNLPVISLEEGVRYRVIDVEAIRAKLKQEALLMRVAAALLGSMAAAAFLVAVFKSAWEELWQVGIFVAIYGALFIGSRLATLSRERSIDDTVVRVGDQIVIVRSDGSHLHFPASQLSPDDKALVRGRRFGYTDKLSNGRQKYRLNRMRLFASETPLLGEELGD